MIPWSRRADSAEHLTRFRHGRDEELSARGTITPRQQRKLAVLAFNNAPNRRIGADAFERFNSGCWKPTDINLLRDK